MLQRTSVVFFLEDVIQSFIFLANIPLFPLGICAFLFQRVPFFSSIDYVFVISLLEQKESKKSHPVFACIIEIYSVPLQRF